MKKIKLLILFLGLTILKISAQNLSQTNGNVTDVHLSYLRACVPFLDSCLQTHMYMSVTFDPVTGGQYTENLEYLKLFPQWSGTESSSPAITILPGENGFELEMYNQCVQDSVVNFILEGYSHEGSKMFSDYQSISIAQMESEDDGIIDVSEHLDSYLDAFTKSGQSMTQFFCQIPISQIELMSFFREFFELTNNEMCQFITYYNIQTVLEHEKNVNYIWKNQLCTKFEEWYKNLPPEDEDDEEPGCLCQLIRTKSSALNTGVITTQNNYTESDACLNYQPTVHSINHVIESEVDDDLIISQGRLGAAKAAAMEIQFDGSDDSPRDFTTTLLQGWSTLKFRSVCAVPETLTFETDLCVCSKEVEVEYGYYSDYVQSASTGTCILCPTSAYSAIEDWSMFIVENAGITEVADEGAYNYRVSCDADPNEPTLNELMTDIPDIVDNVSTAISNPTVSTIVTGAEAVINLLQASVFKEVCNTLVVESKELMRGTEVYTLNPGAQIQFTIASNAKFGGYVQNHGKSIAGVNSKFYLAAVLKTKPDSEFGVPDYCECEQLGSYTYGSLEGYTPAVPDVHEPNNVITDWETIFDYGTPSADDLKRLVGSFLGTAGEWHGIFEMAGCCDVVIPCQSDCVYVRGCEDIIVTPKPQFNHLVDIADTSLDTLVEASKVDESIAPIKISDQSTQEKKVKVFPKPIIGDILEIQTQSNTLLNKILLVDLTGRVVTEGNIINNNLGQVSFSQIASGTYVLLIKDASDTITVEKIIKL